MAIAVKIQRTSTSRTGNKFLVTAGSGDTGKLQITYNGEDIYNNLSGTTYDILSGDTNTTIYIPLDETTKVIPTGVYYFNFVADVGTSDADYINFQISPVSPVIGSSLDIYAPSLRVDDNSSYSITNSTVSASSRDITMKYPAGSNQSNLSASTIGSATSLYITTSNVWTGSTEVLLNYDYTWTIAASNGGGVDYSSFTYREVGSGYENVQVDRETTLADVYDRVENLRQRLAESESKNRADFDSLRENYEYVGALMVQFREAVSNNKTAALEAIIEKIKYLTQPVSSSTEPTPLSQKVYGTNGGTGGSGTAEWGTIEGTLSAQTDLQNALDDKQDVVTVSANTGLGIDSANSILYTTYNTTKEDDAVSSAVGGAAAMSASTWKTYNIVQVLDAILFPVSAPTYTIPTVSLTATQTGYKEIGSQVEQELLGVFTKNDAGAYSYVEFLEGSTTKDFTNSPTSASATAVPDQFGFINPNSPNAKYTISYGYSFDVVSGATNFYASGNYGSGQAKKYSDGSTDVRTPAVRSTSAPQSAASNFKSTAKTINGVYPYFYGTASTNSITGADIYATLTKVVSPASGTLTIPWSGGTSYLILAIHSSYATKTAWQDPSVAINNGAIGGVGVNLFNDPITISVTSTGLANNYTEDYTVYISDYQTTPTTLQIS